MLSKFCFERVMCFVMLPCLLGGCIFKAHNGKKREAVVSNLALCARCLAQVERFKTGYILDVIAVKMSQRICSGCIIVF